MNKSLLFFIENKLGRKREKKKEKKNDTP